MPQSNDQFRLNHFRCFARNGRWGTCAMCPRDASGDVYPEFCHFTDRYDHLLDVHALAEQWDRRAKEDAKQT